MLVPNHIDKNIISRLIEAVIQENILYHCYNAGYQYLKLL